MVRPVDERRGVFTELLLEERRRKAESGVSNDDNDRGAMRLEVEMLKGGVLVAMRHGAKPFPLS